MADTQNRINKLRREAETLRDEARMHETKAEQLGLQADDLEQQAATLQTDTTTWNGAGTQYYARYTADGKTRVCTWRDNDEPGRIGIQILNDNAWDVPNFQTQSTWHNPFDVLDSIIDLLNLLQQHPAHGAGQWEGQNWCDKCSEEMQLDEAIDTVARNLICQAAEHIEWENIPTIGEYDWGRVAIRIQDIIRCENTRQKWDEAITLLEQRTENASQ